MRKLMHNILFENAEIIAGIMSICITIIITLPIMSSIVDYNTPLSLIFMLFISIFSITIAIFFMGIYLFEEYCYDQKTESENWEKNKYKS